jgi:hypothetical protein
MELKKGLIALAAFAIAVILVILGLTVNLDTIKQWVLGTNIDVSSTTRGKVADYFAGEVLKFSLEDVQSLRVLWAFDEGQPVIGTVEAQFAFPYDSEAPKGQARDHRIDVFFKVGNEYKTASRLIRTSNLEYAASVIVDESTVRVSAPKDFETDWLLTGTSLANFSGGRFLKQHLMQSEAPAIPNQQFTATRNDVIKAFGYPKDTHLNTALATDKQAWTWYNFKNKSTGAILTIAQQVAAPQS